MNDAERREPCGNCPFRRSAPLAYWHPDEYRRLLDIKSREDGGHGSVFNCHKDRQKPPGERGLCVGWLLDQRRRGIPSIALRIRLIGRPDLVQQLEEIRGEEDCYSSVEETVAANLKRDRVLNPHRYEP